MKIWPYVEIFLTITICHQIGHGARLTPTNRTDNTLKYGMAGKFAYSAYSTPPFTNNSTLVFRFKTLKKHGMLFYMDDGGVKDYIDAFLLNGQLRVRLTLGSCRGKQRFINGTFTDLKWQKITLKWTSEAVMLSVASRNTSYKLCNRVRKTAFKKLYVSNFPSEERGDFFWWFRDSWDLSSMHGGFEGCIKTPKYAIGDKKHRRAHLLKSERTVSGCRDACKDASIGGKCYNGGKCVNKVVRRECDCRGTGYHGPNCTQVAVVDSLAGLRFSGQFNKQTHGGGNYAEFIGWPMAETSELQFYFKTSVAKPALLAYQGTGVDDRYGHNDYIEISLLENGRARLQIVGTRCSHDNDDSVQVEVARNFSDGLWHKLTFSRRGSVLSFSVDNISAPTVTCEKPPRLSGPKGEAKKSLFIGGLPLLNSMGKPTIGTWSLTGIMNKIMNDDSLFQGCVALLRFSSASKPFENVKLLKSHVVGNCSGEPCTGKQNMCQHNGTCVDLVTRVECDCEGTGYYGRYCEHSDNLNATGANGGNTTLATAGPDHTGPFKSEPNNNNNNNNNNNDGNNGSPTAREKKDPNLSSSTIPSPGWSLLFSVAIWFLRNVA